MYFKENIRFLRKSHKLTQDEAATALGLKRPTLSGYENGIGHPNLQTLGLFSEFYNVSIDNLIKVNLAELPEARIQELVNRDNEFLSGSRLRVLATTVDSENEENIEPVTRY